MTELARQCHGHRVGTVNSGEFPQARSAVMSVQRNFAPELSLLGRRVPALWQGEGHNRVTKLNACNLSVASSSHHKILAPALAGTVGHGSGHR